MNLINAPKVMAMHDLCSYGRSSLNVVVPLLATTNCYCCSLPTALLSSHFGFGTQPSLLDLSEELLRIYDKWDAMNLHFDAFYSGYLASPEQVAIAQKFIQRFTPRFIYIDPVLGDNGKLYPAFDQKQVKAMRTLLKSAHVSSPNLTEANALLGLPLDQPFAQSNAKNFLQNLSELGPKIAIVTGIHDPERQRITSYLFDKEKNLYFKVHAPLHLKSPKGLHGTGDSFASIVTGRMLAHNDQPQDAVALAMHYLDQAIKGAIRFQEEIAIEYPLEDLIAHHTRAEVENF
ncbi:pyridoxamine kinase [Entomospira culicis]|uniref:pyridoxal kinase n=1 Tax=Entomospira culicis TaxID=2719989 RepID=A0A968KUQ2_9SPIO|nr:pyridoxamine kinase [Entomospira culicis]NIZ19296.1 pyridoxamine kinase [Entomospira culicis]NIZ69799.1 pyridoxamine kinase [Entomospira culicis]WDI36908.1 pyridoxamine kinase [Entomospira culicis]WDI38537.1 pyridoxamine kinase [Entomospira culicis]